MLPPGRAVHIECDNFSRYGFLEREKRIKEAHCAGNPSTIEAEEHPKNWYDWDGIGHAVSSLKGGEDVHYARGWNRSTGDCDAPYALTAPKVRPGLILVDCIYLLHEPIAKRLDAIIYLDVSRDLLARQLRERRLAKGLPVELEHDGRWRYLDETYTAPYFEQNRSRATWICEVR